MNWLKRSLAMSLAWLIIVAAASVGGIEAQDKDKVPQYSTGYKPISPEVKAKLHAENAVRHGPNLMKRLTAAATPPAAFDTVAMGWSQPIQDQGSCGSCYLVSTMDCTTGAAIKAGYGKADGSIRMSDQWGMDCHNFGGCGGGNGTEVIEYIRLHGAPAEKYVDSSGAHSDYPPYIARSSSCRLKAGTKLWKFDWGYVSASPNSRPANVDEIKAALMQYGQLNVSLDAGGQFGGYRSGIITALGTNIDHEISIVGWDDSKQAIKLRNQWNTGWGLGGYAWLSYQAVPRLVDVFWVSITPVTPPDPIPVPPVPVPGAIAVTPATSTILPSGTQQYTADKSPVIWTTSGGTITQTGLLTAPAVPGGSFVVTAFSASDPNVSGKAVFTVSIGPGPGPGPTPVPGATVTLGKDTLKGTYELMPLGTGAKVLEVYKKLKELDGILNPPAPVPQEPVQTKEPPLKQVKAFGEAFFYNKKYYPVPPTAAEMKAIFDTPGTQYIADDDKVANRHARTVLNYSPWLSIPEVSKR